MVKTTHFDHHPVKASKGIYLDKAESAKLVIKPDGSLKIMPAEGDPFVIEFGKVTAANPQVLGHYESSSDLMGTFVVS